jgi:hypothetical protein
MRNYIEFGIEYESCQEEIGRRTSAPDGHWAFSRSASAEAETNHGASVLFIKRAHGCSVNRMQSCTISVFKDKQFGRIHEEKKILQRGELRVPGESSCS